MRDGLWFSVGCVWCLAGAMAAVARGSAEAAGYRVVENRSAAGECREDRAQVLDAVNAFYGALSAGEYGKAYDALPSASRDTLDREAFLDAVDPASASVALSLSVYRLEQYRIDGIRFTGADEAVVTVETVSVNGLGSRRRELQDSVWVRSQGRWVCSVCGKRLLEQAREHAARGWDAFENELVRDELYDFVRDD